MSDFIKNGDGWCQIDPIQPSLAEIQQEVASTGRRWHPLLQGLKRTKCGMLVGGMTHPRPLDPCPPCADCAAADEI